MESSKNNTPRLQDLLINTFNISGENPRGTWKIIIRDNYEQGNGMFSDGSESAPDLEQLEDQVIDSQMKIQAVSTRFIISITLKSISRLISCKNLGIA